MTDPSPAVGRWWARGRHQGLVVMLVVVALVLGLTAAKVFGRTPAPTVTPAGSSSAGVRGVTPTAIKIVLYEPPEDDPVSKVVAEFVAPKDDNAKAEATVRGFIKALLDGNPAMHGRHIDLVVFTGSANLLDSVSARADAVKIAEEIRPFMVWNGPLAGTAFADELASRGVMCLMCVNAGTNAFFADHAPYIFSMETTPEQVGAQVAEYVQKRLAGRKATFAGSPELRRAARRFGLISVDGPFGGHGLGPSIAGNLQNRGVELTDDMAYGESASVNQVQGTMIGRLKARGVTTVIYGADPVAMGSFMAEATRQQWFPEWVMTGGFSSERSSWGRRNDPAQMAHAFGVTPLVPPVSPNIDYVINVYRTTNGVEPPARQSTQMLFAPVFLFQSALVAADGNLSPEPFRQGLFDAATIGGDPNTPYVPLMSYGHKGIWPYPDFAGIDDFTEIWWDASARGADEFGEVGKGLWAFADGGRRYLPGKWPTDDSHAFIPDGAVTRIVR